MQLLSDQHIPSQSFGEVLQTIANITAMVDDMRDKGATNFSFLLGKRTAPLKRQYRITHFVASVARSSTRCMATHCIGWAVVRASVWHLLHFTARQDDSSSGRRQESSSLLLQSSCSHLTLPSRWSDLAFAATLCKPRPPDLPVAAVCATAALIAWHHRAKWSTCCC